MLRNLLRRFRQPAPPDVVAVGTAVVTVEVGVPVSLAVRKPDARHKDQEGRCVYNDWCGDHRLDENRVAEGYGRGIADAQRTDALRHELELEAVRKERDHYLSACEELQRDNESLSRALDRMTDKAASLAGIKP
jgi:hypothetical protein